MYVVRKERRLLFNRPIRIIRADRTMLSFDLGNAFLSESQLTLGFIKKGFTRIYTTFYTSKIHSFVSNNKTITLCSVEQHNSKWLHYIFFWNIIYRVFIFFFIRFFSNFFLKPFKLLMIWKFQFWYDTFSQSYCWLLVYTVHAVYF